MALSDFQPLIEAANQLLQQAHGDPALAERLLQDPKAEIERAAGQPVPEGVLLDTTRGDDGMVKLTASIDPDFEGEIDDQVLEAVSGGADLGGLFVLGPK